jgi:hypothetical protein
MGSRQYVKNTFLGGYMVWHCPPCCTILGLI